MIPMAGKILISILLIFTVCGLWMLVQQGARRFAERHPEFGPAREEGGGCGFHCRGKDGKPCLIGKLGFCHTPNESKKNDAFPKH
jgi:hypothetical protein